MLAVYIASSAAALLLIAGSWRLHVAARRFIHDEFPAPQGSGDPRSVSALELGPRIFDSADCLFVLQETSARSALRFRDDRSLLALEWLRQLRSHTNSVMRLHARAVGRKEDLRVSDELKLLLEFLVFHAVTLCLVFAVWARGPFYAARLARYAISLGTRLAETTSDPFLPAAQPAVHSWAAGANSKGRSAAR